MKLSSVACLSLCSSVLAADRQVRSSSSGSSSGGTHIERKLEFSRICGYEPQSQVTDQAALDLDQQIFEQELFLGKVSQARNVYVQGGHSRSYAQLKLIYPADAKFPAGATVIGKAPDQGEVIGKLVDKAEWTNSTGHNKIIKVLYATSDKQEKYVGCQVGGLYTFSNANLNGCFNDTGHISIMGSNKASSQTYKYSYNIRVDNANARTLQLLSTEANLTMRKSENPCSVCPYLDDFNKFVDYYGDPDYADKWVMGASYNKTVEFSSGRGAANFPVFKSTGALASAQAKATVLMTVAMAVIQQMEHAVVACDKKKTKCTDANATCPHDPTPYIDSAVAFYAGSLQGDDGSGEGKMYFDATNRMALRFATCGESGNDDVGEAWVNGMVIREFQKAQQNLMHGSCALARKSKEHIVNMMKVPLVQGVLQYAHKRQFEASTNHEVAEQEVAEGATFAAALLPYLHACNAQDAEVVYENLQVTASSVNFAQVKGALERNYGCLGVTCESVGGVWTVNGYAQGASPCVTQPTGASSPGGIAALTIGTICSLGLIGFLYLRYRQRKLRKDRQRTSNIAAVSEIA